MSRYLVRISISLMLTVVPFVMAQETGETASVRFILLNTDSTPLTIYVNGDIFEDEAIGFHTDALVGPGTLYFPLPPDSYQLAIAQRSSPLDDSLFETETSFEAGKNYSVILYGSDAEGTLQMMILNDTELLASADVDDLETHSVTVWFHALLGADAVNFSYTIDGHEAHVEDVDYGQYAVSVNDLTGDGPYIGDVLVNAAVSPGLNIFKWEDAPTTRGVYTLAALIGRFPGYRSMVGLPSFKGILSISDGGALILGDAVQGEFTESGQRVRYTVTLDNAARVRFTMRGPSTVAYLRLYTADGDLLAASDITEFVSNRDEVQTLDMELDAGIYDIEAATYADIGTGKYLLTTEIVP